MRFNVSVWHPRDRQREKGKAFLEPRVVTKRERSVAEHPNPKRNRVVRATDIV